MKNNPVIIGTVIFGPLYLALGETMDQWIKTAIDVLRKGVEKNPDLVVHAFIINVQDHQSFTTVEELVKTGRLVEESRLISKETEKYPELKSISIALRFP